MTAASARRPRTTRAPRVVVFILTVLAVDGRAPPRGRRVGARAAVRGWILEYVRLFTGDLDSAGTAVESKFLRFEQNGWYQILYDQTSAGWIKYARFHAPPKLLRPRAPAPAPHENSHP